MLLPEIGAEGIKASQALVARAVGMDKDVLDVACLAQRTFRISEGARDVLRVGIRPVGTHLTADPAGTETSIIQTIEGHGMTVGAKRMTVLVVAASDASVLILVPLVVTYVDGGDSLDRKCVV